jgi:hypothetical protein
MDDFRQITMDRKWKIRIPDFGSKVDKKLNSKNIFSISHPVTIT